MKKVAQASLLASLIISAVHAQDFNMEPTVSSEQHYYQPTVLEDDVLASEVVEDNTSHQTGITAYATAKAQKFANLTKDFSRNHPNVTYAAITTASLIAIFSIASKRGEYHEGKNGAKFTLDRTNGIKYALINNLKAIAGTFSIQYLIPSIGQFCDALRHMVTRAVTYPFTQNTSSSDANSSLDASGTASE